ncbi:MAG: DJ-1/PfpI family protein [Bauldia sp.]|nr:DJ-1/PfpI family protein [Bauldia sp.]
MRIVLLSLGAILLIALVAAPILLAPRPVAAGAPAIPPVEAAEQAAIVEAMRPPKRERPVIAIVTRNEGTEVTDFLVSYGVLKRADVADVVVVAERAETVRLYPGLAVEPDLSFAAFDDRYPEGADFLVIPAMDPGTDPTVADWIVRQHRNGAKVVSVCNGSRMVGTAGLLDGRRATAHWSAVAELEAKYPSMEYVPDRRYVSDDGVTTSTGITASIPTMLALTEAIGGREVAARVAGELGVESWDARHRSSLFELTLEYRKTFIRNNVALWRHERLGVPIEEGVDEIALGLTVDAYARTELAEIVAVAPGGEAVRSRFGLLIRPDGPSEATRVDEMLPAPSPDAPGQTLERELPRIAERYDLPTAVIVAQVMEYPWAPSATVTASR